MEFSNKVTMALEDFKRYDNDEDYEFAYATVDFLSNRPNSHRHKYSENVIKEYAPTVINKWVIAEYDKYTKDATTHTSYQQIVGRVPEQEVKYRYDEDGYLVASVDVVISKLYATDIYEIFRRNNKRAVSIEELVGFTDDTKDYEDGTMDKEVLGFNITGITILGLSYKPSIPTANIQITQMSEDTVCKLEEEYVKYSQKDSKVKQVSMEDIMTKLEYIEQKISKEETMAENKEEVLEEVKVEMSETETETDAEEKMACGTETKEEMSEEEKAEADTEEEMACGEEEKMEDSEDEEEEKDDTEEKANKMAELESKLSEAENKIAQYEAELNELKQFKSDVLMAQKEEIVTRTLAQAKDFCDEETYGKFSKSAETCKFEEINGWRNEVLASISEIAISKMEELENREDGVLEMGMPTETKSTNSLWD